MRLLYELLRPYKCQVCGKELLMFQTDNNRLMDYKIFIDQAYSVNDLRKTLRNHHVKYLKCISCDRSYLIDWSKGWPTQMLDKTPLMEFGVGQHNEIHKFKLTPEFCPY